MQAMVRGEWDVAKSCFEDVLKQSNNRDGPSQLLLARMKEYEFKCPESWPGYWQT
jgi:hypothetical protein